MNPDQLYAPAPSNNYDFIMNPTQPPKRKMFGGTGSSSFFVKIALILGGVLVLIMVLALGVNMIFGGGTNLESYVDLTQREQEIARLSELGEDATAQPIKNAAANTKLSMMSHQQTWLAYLDKKGRAVKKAELGLKKDSTQDKKLELAQQTSTFDETYLDLMREQLTAYAAAIKKTYDGTSGKTQREILNNQFKDVGLLLEQWPK